jgi:putative transposase
MSEEMTDNRPGIFTVTKSKKIRVYPNRDQRAMLRQWLGCARYVYNRTVEYLQHPDTQANWKVIKTDILHSLPDWAKSVPYQIKSIAIRDACLAVRKAKQDYNQTGGFQKVKFRSRKDKTANVFIPSSAISDKGVYHTVLGRLKLSETLPETPKDSRLIYDGAHFYLCVTYRAITQKREPSGRIVALDPGVRTFLTYFCEDRLGWLGYHAINKIQRLCHHLDDLLSRAALAKRPKRRNMRKAANQLRNRIRNFVSELHRKVARFLVDTFDIILLPMFNTQDMCQRGKRKLRKQSVRQMLTLSHYQFKRFLQHKAYECGVRVIEVCEAYTSKTVSWTGEIVENIGGKKVIKSSDGSVMDRDLNGARGILLRALGDSPELQQFCSFANRA